MKGKSIYFLVTFYMWIAIILIGALIGLDGNNALAIPTIVLGFVGMFVEAKK